MVTRAAALAAAVAVAGLLLFGVAGLGTRFGLWEFRTGFTLLRWGAYLGIAGAVLCLVALVATRPGRAGTLLLVAAAVAGAVAAWVPWRQMRQARLLPPIHDITTDLDDPPTFEAVLPLRAGAPNPATYGGPEVAAAQRSGYPDLAALRLNVPPPEAYQRALAAAHRMGWDIVAADSAAGRIEATATTAWFGFKDDVVVRVRGDSAGARVDVRSVSRVGRSDVGTNARRIREYLRQVAAAPG
jgi:uncharacterized protein (DUF1499 family)